MSESRTTPDDDTDLDPETPPVEEIVFTPESVQQLREELVKPDELERTAFVRCAQSGRKLLVVEVRTVLDEQMRHQGRTECRPELDLERREIHQGVNAGWTVLHVHSHPFSDHPRFSSADTTIMPKLTGWTAQFHDNSKILFAVIGRRGIQATWYHQDAEEFVSVSVTVLGGWTMDHPLEGATNSQPAQAVQQTATEASPVADARFDRHYRAFGEEGQQRLLATEVTIIGAGGLGSNIAEQLARVGVGTINLIDPDHLEQSNIPRVYGAYEADIGVPKVEALRLHLKRINSNLEITTHETVVEADAVATVLKRSDAVIAGLDRMRSRSFLNQFCIRHGIPYFDAGVVIDTKKQGEDDADAGGPGIVNTMDGFLQTVIPGTTACFDCLKRIDTQQTRLERLPDKDVEVEVDEGYVEGAALTPEPAVITLNTTLAGMAVSELVNYLTGIREPRGFLHYEALTNEISLLDARGSRRTNCPTCGENGVLFHGEVTTEPEMAELPDTVDSDLSSIPTPEEPAGETAEEVDSADGATQNDDTATSMSALASSTVGRSATQERPASAIGSADGSQADSLSQTMSAFSTYVKEVLPWN